MIVAEIFRQSDGKIVGFSINGHSNTAPPGYDIYCAGVSSLSQSAFLCIRDHLKRDFQADFAHGRLMMQLKNSADDLTEAVFQTMIIGIQEIEKIAPKIVKLKFKTVKNNFVGGEKNVQI